MKIINPKRKSDIILRQLHNFHERFESMIALRAKLIEEFKEQVPDSLSFSVGYFEGQAHSKLSLVSGEDLNAMYTTYRSGLITLWCDGRSEPTEDSASG